MSRRTSAFYRKVHQQHEPKVGLLVLLVLGVWAVVLVGTRGVFGGETGNAAVTVVFENVEGLTAGDPVMVSGVVQGRVRAVRLDVPGRVLVTLDVREAVRPRVDATAAVRPLDVLGSRYVDYRPGSAADFLQEGTAVGGTGDDPAGATARRIREYGARVAFAGQDLFDEEFRTEVRETRAAIARAQTVAAGLSPGRMATDAGAVLEDAQRAVTRLDSLLSYPAGDSSATHLADLRAEFRDLSSGISVATRVLDRILLRIDSGQGTAGRLRRDTILRANLREVITVLRRYAK